MTHYDGFAVNPELPEMFFNCANESRPLDHAPWYNQPFIQCSGEWYSVWCLDGGCWDRPTWWGESKTLSGAADIARKNRPSW
jgi:hypothetical protein